MSNRNAVPALAVGNAIYDGRAKARSSRDVGSADGCRSGRLPSPSSVSVSKGVSSS